VLLFDIMTGDSLNVAVSNLISHGYTVTQNNASFTPGMSRHAFAGHVTDEGNVTTWVCSMITHNHSVSVEICNLNIDISACPLHDILNVIATYYTRAMHLFIDS
jgi:hypothetical protein